MLDGKSCCWFQGPTGVPELSRSECTGLLWTPGMVGATTRRSLRKHPKAFKSSQQGPRLHGLGGLFNLLIILHASAPSARERKEGLNQRMGGFSTNEVNTRPLINLRLRFAPNSAAGHAWLHCFAFGSR